MKIKSIYKSIRNKMTVPKLNLALVAILVAFVCYTLFAPITPAVYGTPMVQDSSNIYAGHTLTYKIHACRRVGQGVVTTITRQLVPVNNKTLQPINLSTDTVTNVARCSDTTKTLLVPYSTPDGQYRLLIRGVYDVIPLRQPLTVSAESAVFPVHGTSIAQEIQDLIDQNSVLQAALSAQVPKTNSSTTPTTTKNSNGSTTTSTNTNATTTTGGSGGTNPKAPTSPTTPTTPVPTPDPSLVQQIIKALGGGINLQL